MDFLMLQAQQYLLMELKQGHQEALARCQSRQIVSGPKNQQQTFQIVYYSTFWDHYACLQDPTGVFIGEFNKSSIKSKRDDSNLVDYVDQFLWNRAVSDDSPIPHILHLPHTSQMQREINIHNVQPPPSDGLNNQLQVDPIPIQPTQQLQSLQLSKDYKKNLAGYIVKKVIRMLLAPSFSARFNRLCHRADVDPTSLKGFLEQSLPRVFGPNSIYQLFFVKQAEERGMKRLLLELVERTLRKRYTLQILRQGRMRDYDAYMGVKNKGLLYFSNLLR